MAPELTYHHFRRGAPKYKNKSCRCLSPGHAPHHSIFEAGYCNSLFADREAGKIRGFTTQIKIDIRVNNEHITNYYCDFLVVHNDGLHELVETKGFWTAEALLKNKVFRATFLKERPHIRYTVVNYEKSNRRSFKSKRIRR